MILNKIADTLKLGFRPFLDPLKKIAEDLSQISAYIKKPENGKTLAILEKRITPSCNEEKLKEWVGDHAVLLREGPALHRLAHAEEAKINEVKTKIADQEAQIQKLEQEQKKLREKMTSPWESLWDRGKLLLGTIERTPKDMAELLLSVGTSREAKLFAEMQHKQNEQSAIEDEIRPAHQEIRKREAQISFYQEQQNLIEDKIAAFESKGKSCANLSD